VPFEPSSHTGLTPPASAGRLPRTLGLAIPMSDIFISYKREEREVAKLLASHLESLGWSVWWDLSLKGGNRFDEVIEHEIRQAARVVVLWSPKSVDSTFVRDEAYLALALGTLLPVMIEPVELPFLFRSIHTIDLSAWHNGTEPRAIDLLVRDIRSALQPTETPEKTALPPRSTPNEAREFEVTHRVSLEPLEIDILRLVSNGRSNSEVSTMLNLTEEAVDLYLRNAQQKLGASNKHTAVLFAMRAHAI
jgi:DNA-binding CsgD family transcriptional regulator